MHIDKRNLRKRRRKRGARSLSSRFFGASSSSLFIVHLLEVTLALSLCLGELRASNDIKVPFGFQWGESPERVERMLTSVKATIEDKCHQDGRIVYTVHGITQRLLIKTLFYFDSDALTEIELRYGEPNWTEGSYSSFFDRTRRHIEEKYGPGRLIVQTRSEQHGCLHTLMGYQWTQRSASLQLFYFTANPSSQEDEKGVYLLSLHYRSM